MTVTRRSMLKTVAMGAAMSAVAPLSFEGATTPDFPADDKQFHGLKVGACSYSLRSLPAADALHDVQRLGVRYVSIKDVHLPLTSTPEERKQFRQQAEQLGLTITSCGVIYMKNDQDEMRKSLDYVKDLGATVAVVGVNREMLPTLDKVVQGYDLRVAIHNHGPNDKLFPSPLEVYEAIRPFDKKIGLCMDIGHTFRMHEDLVADVKKTFDRLYSMHFKDLESGEISAKGVPVGTGVLPIVPLLRELVRSKYSGEIQLEYEVEPKDPVPGMAESFGFMRGTLQSIG